MFYPAETYLYAGFISQVPETFVDRCTMPEACVKCVVESNGDGTYKVKPCSFHIFTYEFKVLTQP